MAGGFGNLYLQKMTAQIPIYKRNSPDLYFYNSTEGKWYFKEGRGGQQFGSANFTHSFLWPGPGGGALYQPVVGDFNDDGKVDIGVRRTDTGTWYFAFSDGLGNYFNTRNFSWAADGAGVTFQPIVGDFNGDGKTDIGLRRADTGTWYFAFFDGVGNYFNTRNFNWGGDGAGITYQPTVGDFDCDGRTDIGLRRADTGINYLANFDGGSQYFNYANNNYAGYIGSAYKVLNQPLQCTEP
jgi:FG-GAP-like repeat